MFSSLKKSCMFVVLFAAAASAGVEVFEKDNKAVIENGTLKFVYDLSSGSYDAIDMRNNSVCIKHGYFQLNDLASTMPGFISSYKTRRSMVMGGLTYHDFEKFAVVSQPRKLELTSGPDGEETLVCYLNLPEQKMHMSSGGDSYVVTIAKNGFSPRSVQVDDPDVSVEFQNIENGLMKLTIEREEDAVVGWAVEFDAE